MERCNYRRPSHHLSGKPYLTSAACDTCPIKPIQYTAVHCYESTPSANHKMVLRFPIFVLLLFNAFVADGIPDYRRCPVGCNCTSTSTATCDTMDFPSFSIDITKLKIKEPNKSLNLEPNFFAKRHLKNVDTISIESATVEILHPSAFDDLEQLISVSFVNCTLPKIDPDIFVSATSLSVLEFEDTTLKEFNLLKSESLTQLKISGGGLQKITNDTFSYLVELKSLTLVNDNIEEMESGAFANLLNLEDLNVTNNKISNLPADLFLHNEELVVLDLSGNHIKTTDVIVAPNVEKLLLRNCMLKQFDGKDNFNALDYLDLSQNQIDIIPNTAFQRMPDLEYIDLSRNYFNALPVDLFANNSRLSKIVLDHNDLQTLPKFENSETFQTYFFSCNFCELEILKNDTFEYMPGLIILNLSNNRIQKLTGKVFATIKSLNKLDLSYNFITTIDNDVFEHKSALSNINLSGNQITYLDPMIFAKTGVLKTLDLSNNVLTHIWKPTDSQIRSLRVLNVASNKLETVSKEELEVTINLETLNLNNNDLQCTDDLRGAIEWLTNHSVTPVVLTTHEELINIDYNWASESDNDFIWQDIIFDSCDDNDDYEFTNDLSIINRGIEVIESRIPEHVRYNFMWLVLVFVLTALLVLFIVLNIVLFVLRKRGQLPRNMNLSWKNGHGGFVYKPLTEDIAGSQYHLEKPTELPTVHRQGH